MHSQARKRSVIVAVTLELQCSCGHERLLLPTQLVLGTTDCGVNACVMMLQGNPGGGAAAVHGALFGNGSPSAAWQLQQHCWRHEIMANHHWHVTGSSAALLIVLAWADTQHSWG